MPFVTVYEKDKEPRTFGNGEKLKDFRSEVAQELGIGRTELEKQTAGHMILQMFRGLEGGR